MEFKELIEVIESAEMTPRSYSGRGMGGRECLGITCDNSAEVPLNLVAAFCENEFRCTSGDIALDSLEELQNLIEQLKGSKVDSMGRGEIVYWPQIKWQELDEEEPDLTDVITPEHESEWKIKNS
jgi:hypothetical protein